MHKKLTVSLKIVVYNKIENYCTDQVTAWHRSYYVMNDSNLSCCLDWLFLLIYIGVAELTSY